MSDDRAVARWTLAQAMRDLQRHRMLWAILGSLPADWSMRRYWDSLR